ncbi:hypothetical protein SAMN05216267_103967 [Actinacidiphila rubida]|uniref:Uncharacterized protein n=1 Tax=Actinacidiphila rubida TaxID=310780 RepID=A0A1H8S6E6_9ACTN|nr:hypothetical protein [Actinacidiphila rubida]SEO73974.1 hypothetical protein SAMN05216267_103967 [Actinacidiphila rubida]
MNTVGELIEHLRAFDPASSVRLAINPDFPFSHSIGDITALDENGRQTVFIAENGHQEHLPVPAAQALGWLPLTESPVRTRRTPLRVAEEDN